LGEFLLSSKYCQARTRRVPRFHQPSQRDNNPLECLTETRSARPMNVHLFYLRSLEAMKVRKARTIPTLLRCLAQPKPDKRTTSSLSSGPIHRRSDLEAASHPLQHAQSVQLDPAAHDDRQQQDENQNRRY
jgi:hypothetical protein